MVDFPKFGDNCGVCKVNRNGQPCMSKALEKSKKITSVCKLLFKFFARSSMVRNN